MKKTCDQTVPVGYGSPPVATRFEPGVSGNPAGRPKGRPNARSVLVEALRKPVQHDAQDEPVEALAAIIAKQIALALKGDRHASRTLIGLADRYGLLRDQRSLEPQDLSKLSEEDLAHLEDLIQKMSEGDADNEEARGAGRLVADMSVDELKAEIARREQG